MSPKKDTKKFVKGTALKDKKTGGFTAEEKAAMKERARELKAEAEKADGESVLLAKIAEIPEPDRSMGHYIAWTVVALAGLFTVVITHHMSSYILTALLIALVIFYLVRSRVAQKGPWDLALVALSPPQCGCSWWRI